MADPETFHSLVARRRFDGGVHRFSISDDWLQGRTCFGGLVSAIAVQAMRDQVGQGWPTDVSLRALQTSFVGPVGAGAVQVAVKLLRQGRHVCQVQAEVSQGDAIAAVLLGVFSAERESSLRVRRPEPAATSRAADPVGAAAPPPAQAPAYLVHFDMRWLEGPPPFSGGEGWHTRLALRMNDADVAEVPTELQAVLLADLSPTPVMGHLQRYAPNSSVTWALELRPVPPTAPQGWWQADNESLMVEGGYVNHAAKLWSPDGRIAAFGTQLVAVFA
jgi:acyl-CoA thioesterase